MDTDFDRLGGQEGLERIVRDFVDRVFDDFVIGFLFEGRDKARIVRHEVELASVHSGGPGPYRGRGIGSVHRPLRINRGHFRRRHAILRHVLEKHGVPPEVIARWIASGSRGSSP